MALLDSTRIRRGPTPAERVALTLAAWISVAVADRMARRERRLTRACTAPGIDGELAANRDRERARAYLLGIR